MVSALNFGVSSSGSALAGDIALCSWARHFTLMVPLSTQEYKWVPANFFFFSHIFIPLLTTNYSAIIRCQ